MVGPSKTESKSSVRALRDTRLSPASRARLVVTRLSPAEARGYLLTTTTRPQAQGAGCPAPCVLRNYGQTPVGIVNDSVTVTVEPLMTDEAPWPTPYSANAVQTLQSLVAVAARMPSRICW
jgi:hypothetical protein